MKFRTFCPLVLENKTVILLPV